MPCLQKYFMNVLTSTLSIPSPFSCLQRTPAEFNSFEILYILPKMLNKINDKSIISVYSF